MKKFSVLWSILFISTIVWCIGPSLVQASANQASEDQQSDLALPIKNSAFTAPSVPKISAGLSKKMGEMTDEDTVRVGIWLTGSEIQSPKRPEPGDSEASISAFASDQQGMLQSAIARKQEPVLDLLAEKNAEIIYASPISPLIFVEMKAADVKDLESRSDVAGIDIEHEFKPNMDYAMPAILAPVASANVEGAAKVAIVDVTGIAYANPYLKNGTYKDPANPNIGAHATACAGVIGSTHDTTRGIAYKGANPILSANAASLSEADLIAAEDWAVGQGAKVILNAWGPADPDDGDLWTVSKHSDYLVRSYAVTIVAPAGNEGGSAYPRYIVGDPAKAFNVIAVGSFKNQATGWIWADDTMSAFSSWGDPTKPSGARMKPEVVASGESATNNFKATLTASPWTGWYGGAGTSFAAAAVAGEAAVLIYETPWLSSWPEAVKAVIMASANHNIEGDSRKSEYDGVGAVNAKDAWAIAKTTGTDQQYGGASFSYTSGVPVYVPSQTTVPNGIHLSMGQQVRAVIVWDSKPTADNSADALNADLDLYIERNVSGTWQIEPLAGYSISSNNNFEILEFNAPYTGDYRLKVVKYSWLDPAYSEYIGWAIWKGECAGCDDCPPGGITNLRNTTYAQTFINWAWTDPTDTDFDKVMMYLNGAFWANSTKGSQFANATGLTPSTGYILATHTVDTTGNVNLDWVNHTAWTAPLDAPTVASITPTKHKHDGKAFLIRINGTGFQTGLTPTPTRVILWKTVPTKNITASEVGVSRVTSLDCRFKIPKTAKTGAYSITVINPDGQRGTLVKGFKIIT